MTKQETIDLYVKAVDLAKEKDGLSNQDKILLNRFKILLRSGAVEDANSELAQVGKINKKALHRIREMAESLFEDWVRNLDAPDAERDRILDGGKKRADFAEEYLLNELVQHGMLEA